MEIEIQETIFGPNQYLTLRKVISTSQITDKQMYGEAGKKLGEYVQKNKVQHTRGWSVLYFLWDEQNQKADIGIAFPVTGLTEVTDTEFTITDIPKTDAAMAVLRGSYDGLGNVHQALMRYIVEHDLKTDNMPVMAIEEYIVDPTSDPNPENWITNIYYLHQ